MKVRRYLFLNSTNSMLKDLAKGEPIDERSLISAAYTFTPPDNPKEHAAFIAAKAEYGYTFIGTSLVEYFPADKDLILRGALKTLEQEDAKRTREYLEERNAANDFKQQLLAIGYSERIGGESFSDATAAVSARPSDFDAPAAGVQTHEDDDTPF